MVIINDNSKYKKVGMLNLSHIIDHADFVTMYPDVTDLRLLHYKRSNKTHWVSSHRALIYDIC